MDRAAIGTSCESMAYVSLSISFSSSSSTVFSFRPSPPVFPSRKRRPERVQLWSVKRKCQSCMGKQPAGFGERRKAYLTKCRRDIACLYV
jgi:hypothetical protein